MKCDKRGTILFSLLFVGLTVWGQTPEIFVDLWRYQQISGNTFEKNGKVEVYYRVPGNSLTFTPSSSAQFTAKVQVSCSIYLLREQDSIKLDTRTRIFNPRVGERENELEQYPPIIEKEVFTLPKGAYNLRVEIQDLQAQNSPSFRFNRDFIMQPPAQSEFAFSDIALVQDDPVRMRLKKRFNGENEYKPFGKFFTPLITNESLVNEDSLVFYVQLYNLARLGKQSQLIERARITKNGRNVYAPHTETEENPRNFQVFIHTFDISKLSNDTYHLIIELLTPDGRILRTTRKKFYLYNYRSENEFKYFISEVYSGDVLSEFSEKALRKHIETLEPISDEQEIQFAHVLRSKEQIKNYVYSFWNKRRKGNLTLTELIKGYEALVRYLNGKFSHSSLEGWQTDRGKIWLKYGAPNDIEQFPSSPTERAYEIWRYNRLGNQKNVSFIFLEPQLEGRRLVLIHSDKYGEVKDPRWRSRIGIN